MPAWAGAVRSADITTSPVAPTGDVLLSGIHHEFQRSPRVVHLRRDRSAGPGRILPNVFPSPPLTGRKKAESNPRCSQSYRGRRLVGTQDVWVRAQSVAFGNRLVRADTIVEVTWERSAPQFLTFTLTDHRDEVRHQIRGIGSAAPAVTEEEGTALVAALLKAIAATAFLPGAHLLVLTETDGTGLRWRRAPLHDIAEEAAS